MRVATWIAAAACAAAFVWLSTLRVLSAADWAHLLAAAGLGAALASAATSAALDRRSRSRVDAGRSSGAERDARVARLLDTIPAAVVSTFRDGSVAWANRRWLDTSGVAVHTLEEWAAHALHPEDRDRMVRVWSDCAATGASGEVEVRTRASDGTDVWMLGRVEASCDAEGAIERCCCIFTKIDSQRRSLDSLRRSERELRLVIDMLPVFVHATSASGELELVNQRVLDFFGLPYESLKDFTQTTHPDDVERVTGDIARSLRTGTPLETESRGRRFDGVYRWFAVRGVPLHDESGQIVRWYNVLTDIDDRKRAEEALRASERSLRLVLDSIPAFIHTMNASGQIEFVNQRVLEYFWLPLEQVIDWGEVTHPEDRDRVAAAVAHSLATGLPCETESRARRADGVYRWFQVRGTPLRDARGEVERWYYVLTDIDDRKRAEDALRTREQDLRLVLDSIPGLIHTTTPTGEIELVNQPVLDFFGVSIEELRNWATVTHPDDLERVAEEIANSLRTGTPLDTESRGRRADGVYRWFSVRGKPLRDARGQIVRWYKLITDIDDRVRAENALRESEQRWRLMVDSIPGLICTNTAAGDVEHVNKTLLDYTGKPLSELLDWTVVVHPDDLPQVAARWERSVVSGCAFDVEVRVRGADGVYRWFHCRGLPLRGPDGSIMRWYNLLTDIEDRKRAEEMLLARERELASIIETIPAMVWCAASDGTLTYANSLTLEYSGVPFETLHSDPYRYIHPDDLERVGKRWLCALESGRPYECRYRMRRADGQYRWVQSIGQLGRDDAGGPTRWYGVLIDEHDRLQTEEVLRETSAKLERAAQVATLGELSAAIAHEINQPLAAIVTNGHVCRSSLETESPDVARALVGLERISRDARAAADVIERIRALYRHVSMTRQLLDLNRIIDEVCELLAPDLRDRSIQLRTQLDAALPAVLADRVQMQQLLLNLARNAIEAMESGDEKKLSIATRGVDDGVLLTVQDTGVGIESGDAIFDPFFTTKPQGMGMGLAICRSIVDAHGGRLWAVAATPSGAVLSVLLPSSANPVGLR